MKKSIALLMTLLAGAAFARPAYVTDELQVTVRTGESAQHRIVSMVKSGTQVNVVSHNPETGYSKVVLSGGREGYILTRQLLDEPVARDQLAALQAEVAALKTAPDELRDKLTALTREHKALQSAHTELQDIKRETEQELAALQRTSANAVRISNERNDLRKQVAELTRTAEELKAEKRELENNNAQRWFLIGGGVTTGGILIGLILPHLRIRRRKDSWGSL